MLKPIRRDGNGQKEADKKPQKSYCILSEMETDL
jgi:hypothetical protein